MAVFLLVFLGVGLPIIMSFIYLNNSASRSKAMDIHSNTKLAKQAGLKEITVNFKNEKIDLLSDCLKKNDIQFSESQFEKFKEANKEDKDGNFKISKDSMEINIPFNGKDEYVYIVVEKYYKLGNILHIHCENTQLLDCFEKVFDEIK